MSAILSFISELIQQHPRFFEGLAVSIWMVLVVWYFDYLNDKKKRNIKALRSLISSHIDGMYYEMMAAAKLVVDDLKYTCDKSCDLQVFKLELCAYEGQVKAYLRKEHIEEIFRSLYENGFCNYGPLALNEYKKNKGATIGQNGRVKIGVYEHMFPHIAASKDCELSIDLNIKMYSKVVEQFISNKKSEVPFWKIMANAVPLLKKIIS
jgi:hypothetical protein